MVVIAQVVAKWTNTHESQIGGGVKLHRLWRPDWRQGSSVGRILNAIWMITCWSSLALRRLDAPDVILMGTDPVLSILIAPVWRLLQPKTKIAHWCFDLYPEAAYADGILARHGFVGRVLEWLIKRSYASCDLIVDIGLCMRALLERYKPGCAMHTLVPWALSEPGAALAVPQEARAAIFKEAKLALLYSGTLGRAHSYQDLLDLLRVLRAVPVHLAFSVQGNREDLLRAALVEEDTNISIIPFAAVDGLEERLAATDIHVVSLRPEWTGTVVPSKFFGALAVGRPVLFCGSRQSAIAHWIEEYKVGWVLEPGHAIETAAHMITTMRNTTEMLALRAHCHRVYQQFFAKEKIIQEWSDHLYTLLGRVQNSGPGRVAADPSD